MLFIYFFFFQFFFFSLELNRCSITQQRPDDQSKSRQRQPFYFAYCIKYHTAKNKLNLNDEKRPPKNKVDNLKAVLVIRANTWAKYCPLGDILVKILNTWISQPLENWFLMSPCQKVPWSRSIACFSEYSYSVIWERLLLSFYLCLFSCLFFKHLNQEPKVHLPHKYDWYFQISLPTPRWAREDVKTEWKLAWSYFLNRESDQHFLLTYHAISQTESFRSYLFLLLRVMINSKT